MALGPGAITYAVSDAIVDAYQPVINGLEASIDDIERDVFDVSQRAPTERIYGLVGEVLDSAKPPPACSASSNS